MTVDLFEAKDMRAVVRNLHSLGRVAQVSTLRLPLAFDDLDCHSIAS